MKTDTPIHEPAERSHFQHHWDCVSARAHQINVDNGWWEDFRNNYELIALMHSELSEAVEALRHRCPPSEKLPGLGNLEEELADTVIRIMDFAAANRLDVARAIEAKLTYNAGRGYKHGGKQA